MGRQAALDDEAKRARQVQEERQAAEDVRRAESHELDAQRTRFGLGGRVRAGAVLLDGEDANACERQGAHRGSLSTFAIACRS